MRIQLLLVMALTLGGSTLYAGEKAAGTQAAVDAANVWLTLLDQGKYDESWKESASVFRSKVPAAAWTKQIAATRGLFGKFKSRKVKGSQELSSLPGAPDGKYVVIQFDASFEKKQDAVETITPTLDSDGKWRVSGYFIK